jgi:hypothetical protein
VPENPQTPKKKITPDWLVQGALTRIGDTFDKLTGRGWRPSSSLATSGLIERMKMLLEAEIKVDDEGRKYVPHNITLKMQWDKFSTDSDESLRKLENELLTAAVDFISDNRYYTHAPIKLEAKPDYFTEGVKLFVSYEKFDEERGERELNVTVPAAQVAHLIPAEFAAARGCPCSDRSLGSSIQAQRQADRETLRSQTGRSSQCWPHEREQRRHRSHKRLKIARFPFAQ